MTYILLRRVDVRQVSVSDISVSASMADPVLMESGGVGIVGQETADPDSDDPSSINFWLFILAVVLLLLLWCCCLGWVS